MKLIIDDQNEGTRIDLFLSELLTEVSRSKIQKAIKDGSILVNGSGVKASYILKQDDLLNIDIKDRQDKIIQPESLPLEVVWEDDSMAVINKPSGMLTHPTSLETSGTLVNALLYKYGDNLSDINGDYRRGIIHRLDRNTSGLIMIAKTNLAHEFLVNEMKNKNFVKKYIAIVKGVIKENNFRIDLPVGRHPTQPHKQAVNGLNAKESQTRGSVLKRFKDSTYVELELITGRTHQIRVHMAAIGHPVYNDTLYGFGKMKIKTPEQVLQSYKLEFTKPFTTKRISLEIEPDDDFKRVLDFLDNKQ